MNKQSLKILNLLIVISLLIPSSLIGLGSAQTCALVGDANCDGVVNVLNYNIWKGEFVNKVTKTADFNKDGVVSTLDFEIWRKNFITPVTTIPISTTSLNTIAVRQVSGVGEFYDTTTGTKFTPRGNNYIRLANQPDTYGGANLFYHSTFDVGKYNAVQIETALNQMNHDGYNIVRVFINENTIGNASGSLDPQYLQNFVSFLNLAQKYKIYVMATFTLVPKLGGYTAAVADPNVSGGNFYYLSKEFLDSKKGILQIL